MKLLLLIVGLLFIQVAPPPTTGTIEGTVVNSITMAPLANAAITLVVSRVTTATTILSDQGGRFVIPNIAPATYPVTVSLDGFPTAVVTSVTVAAGQTSRINVSLIPGSVISGSVLTEAGMPSVDARVQLWQVRYTNGVRSVGNVNNRISDDRGDYRFFGLPSGEYYVSATAKAIPIRTIAPSAIDLSQATRIQLHAGEEVTGIHISFRPVTPIRISGRVRTSIFESEAATVTLTLVPHTGGLPNPDVGGPTRIAMSSPAGGRFEFTNVLPGVYDLFASLPAMKGYGSAPSSYGRTTIDAGGGDLDGVVVTVNPGVDVKAKLTIDGGYSPSFNLVKVMLQPNDSSSTIGDYDLVGRYAPLINPDGSFTFPSVPEAGYRFHVTFDPKLGPNAYVADVLQSGRSVYDIGIPVNSQAVEPVDVRVRTDGGMVDGIVLDSLGMPFAGATVALVPLVSHRENPELYKISRSDLSGHFSLSGIRPDEYKLLAWDSILSGAYMNMEVLSNYKDKEIPVSVPASIRVDTKITVIRGN